MAIIKSAMSVITYILYNHVMCTTGEIFEKSYLGSVSSMKLNGYYAAALHDGRIHLHLVGKLNLHVVPSDAWSSSFYVILYIHAICICRLIPALILGRRLVWVCFFSVSSCCTYNRFKTVHCNLAIDALHLLSPQAVSWLVIEKVECSHLMGPKMSSLASILLKSFSSMQQRCVCVIKCLYVHVHSMADHIIRFRRGG